MATLLKHKEEILKEFEGLSDKQVTHLIAVIRLIKKSILLQREYDFDLKNEFEGWDKLSDEAILDFERGL